MSEFRKLMKRAGLKVADLHDAFREDYQLHVIDRWNAGDRPAPKDVIDSIKAAIEYKEGRA